MSLKTSATPNYRRRRAGDYLMRGMTVLCTLIAIVPLVLIIGYVLVVGGKALNTEFFTQAYLPPLTVGSEEAGAPSGTPAEPAAVAATAAPADTTALSDTDRKSVV